MPAAFTTRKPISTMPRLPLKGAIDLTYRCNNRCRHCWVRTDDGKGELTTQEIYSIVDEARSMGCREWAISGGEPMLRPDFAEVFDYITSRSRTYTLNTNGTLITPEIAELMKRPGAKMVAIYGATAEVHDHVTRNPGSFDATMRGFDLLREVGAKFIVQIVPMKDNYHQLAEMNALAQSLSDHTRIGASWLFLSAYGDPVRNEEIRAQRLPPKVVVELDPPTLLGTAPGDSTDPSCPLSDDRLYAACIEARRDFHVDPYGNLSFCSFVRDPTMRYDLRAGTFKEGWESFIPSLQDRIRGNQEYREGCGGCTDRQDCKWCSVYGYLEHGRHTAPVEYLCEVARETKAYRERLKKDHRRFYQIGGITVQVDSDIPFSDGTFSSVIESFRTDGPGPDTVRIHHHFYRPLLSDRKKWRQVYRKAPWAIYQVGDSWVYEMMLPDRIEVDEVNKSYFIAVFSHDHSQGDIFTSMGAVFQEGNLATLTLSTSDQILIARLLADRDGFLVHASGVEMNGKGLLFVGHSGAGKSTMSRLVEPHARILCDERNVVRRSGDGWQLHGTWNHSDLVKVSPQPAPLGAVLFLEKADCNRIIPLTDRREIVHRLLPCIIRPFVTPDWWKKTLTSVEQIAREVPCYVVKSDKSGTILAELQRL